MEKRMDLVNRLPPLLLGSGGTFETPAPFSDLDISESIPPFRFHVSSGSLLVHHIPVQTFLAEFLLVILHPAVLVATALLGLLLRGALVFCGILTHVGIRFEIRFTVIRDLLSPM